MVSHDWFLSFRRNSILGDIVRVDIFSAGQNKVINRLVAEFPPIVATFEGVPDEVVGWTCRSPEVVHYTYTKHAYRGLGVARALTAGVRQHTHQTSAGDRLAKKLQSLYNPFLISGV